MQKCDKCGEEITEFISSHETLDVFGCGKIEIVRLACPSCHYVQHIFASDSPVKALGKRIDKLEESMKKIKNDLL